MQEIIMTIITICMIPLMIGVNILVYHIVKDVISGKR